VCGTRSFWLLTSDFRILARGYQTLLFSSLGGSLYSVSGFRGEYKVDDEQLGPRIKGTSLAWLPATFVSAWSWDGHRKRVLAHARGPSHASYQPRHPVGRIGLNFSLSFGKCVDIFLVSTPAQTFASALTRFLATHRVRHEQQHVFRA